MYKCRHCGKPTDYCDLVCDGCFEEHGAVDLLVDIKNQPKQRKHKIKLVGDGELAFCTVCKGGEGELTTECCGRPMTKDERHKVYKLGTLDFRGGMWITKEKDESSGPTEAKQTS